MTTVANRNPRPGDRAPDLSLPDDTGVNYRLSELWESPRRELILVFLRHFG